MNHKILKKVMDFDAIVEIMRLNGSVKWTRFFDSEEDIILALSQIPIIDEYNLFHGSIPAYSGYKYIHSFAKTIQSGNKLSAAQMRQAKRLAAEIKKAYLIRDMW